MTDRRALGRARAIGAVDEAERLGSAVVGTEHLLMVAVSDPVVRWVFRTVRIGADDIRDEVTRTADSRRRHRRTRDGITARAAAAVMTAGTDSDDLDREHPDADEISRVLRTLACRFLVRTTHSAAREVLDGLGLLQHRVRLVMTIEQNAAGARRPRRTTDA